MSKPRALQDLMTAVDAGHVAFGAHTDGSGKPIAPRRSSSHGRGRKPQCAQPPAAPMPETCSDASFEFSAVVSYRSASPASMVFSDGQLRAHQFPAVRSSSPVRRSAPAGSATRAAAGVAMGRKKRVSFAADRGAAAAKAGGGGQGKKSGGLLGCMGSACGSSRNEVVEPARNVNRKVVAV